MVDWFWRLSDFLSQVNLETPLPFKVIDVGHWFKSVEVISYEVRGKWPRNHETYVPVREATHSHYVRKKGLPTTFSSVSESDSLSLNKLALAFSLAIQRFG
jgi:hypothetical protein